MKTDTGQSTKQNAFQAGAFTLPQRAFMAYVRTLQFMKTRLKGIDEGEAVHIPQDEIEQRFFKYPDHPRKENLKILTDAGELAITEQISPATGRTMLMYRAANPDRWQVDLRLIKPKVREYGTQTKLMMQHLKTVSLPPGAPSTPYFDLFLQNKDQYMDYFFTVDAFAGRVHTPVTNFHRSHRPNILIDGSTTVGLDVTTMQPLLLGKILQANIGDNEFSRWINQGEDIYIKLQQAAGLETRDQGKKRFFEILFAPPSDSLADMFGAADWITWINNFKRTHQPKNPHNKVKPYSNLAWLLQTTEVMTMRKVWQLLNESGIIFLSVHDEIIIRDQDRCQAESLFRRVLNDEFTYYRLNVKGAITAAQSSGECDTPAAADNAPQATAASHVIIEGQEKGEIRKPNDNQYNASDKKELADIGISRKESSTPPQAEPTPPEIWQIIEQQFTGRLNPDQWLQIGKTSDEIYYDLTVLAADCLINYGIDVTPDQYYRALRWKENAVNNSNNTAT